MQIVRRLVRTVRSLAGRGPVDRDLDAEVSGYLGMLIDEKVAAGMSPGEAGRQARIELGGIEQVKERVRAARPAAWIDTLLGDIRHGARLLCQAPAFSLAAISVLALGIGANVAVFGLINVLFFQPLAGSGEPGEVVGVYNHDPKSADSYRRFSFDDYEAIRDNTAVFDRLAAHQSVRVVFTDGETTRRANVVEATGSYFSTLGVRLAQGRSFTPDEERPGSGATVAVASHEAARALGGGRPVIGRTVFLNSHPFTVIGIAPEGFTGTMVAFGPLLWIPLGADVVVSESPAPTPSAARTARSFLVAGRLKPSVTVDAATAALQVVSRHLPPGDAREGAREVTVSRLARTEQGDDPRTDAGLIAPMATLAGMALVLLVIASLNVANMQLARGTNRQKEIAMRLALGAGPWRIAGQLVTEGLLLSLAGGAAGLVLGVWTLKLVVVSFTPAIDESVAFPVAPDVRVVLATLGFSLLSAAVFAIGPSLKLSRLNLLRGLKGPAGGDGADRAWRMGPRHLVVAGQVALSLGLLVAAGLFVRAAIEAGRADPGYRLAGQVVVRVDAAGFPEPQGREAFGEVMRRVRALPGVDSATMASLVAFGNESMSNRVQQPGARTPAGADPGTGGVSAQNFAVGAGYFKTLGLPVLRGREFSSSEEQDPAASHVAVIDEPLAAALFPGLDPVGRMLQVGIARAGRPATICVVVGVVPGLRQRLTDRGPVPHVYLPIGAHYGPRRIVHVHLAGDRPTATAEMMRGLREAVRAADPRLSILEISTLEGVRDNSPANWLVRTAGRAFGALGLIALAMAVIGLYGVKSYLVARRTREFGIRMALGATPANVVGMVVKDGGVVVAFGVLAGFLAAVGAGRVVSGLLVGVRPFDPVVFLLATSTLVAAVLAASYIPARRATRVDPSVALRVE